MNNPATVLHDVIVVGGGPAGAAFAALTARAGLKVAVFEKAQFPREKVCGDCLNPRTWDVLRLLKVDEACLSLPHETLKRVEISTFSGFRLQREVVPFIAIRRSVFDRLLLSTARENGAAVTENARVTDLFPPGASGEMWSVNVQLGNGTIERHAGRYLIGADGRNSIVVKKLGLMVEQGRRGTVAVQWHVRSENSLHGSVHLHHFGTGYVGIVSIDESTVNVCLVTDVSAAELINHDFDGFLRRTILRNPFAASVLKKWDPIDGVRITSPVASPTVRRSGRKFALIGDAAGLVEPFTGEGIYCALKDALFFSQQIIRLAGRDFVGDITARKIHRRGTWVNSAVRELLYRPVVFDRCIKLLNSQQWLENRVWESLFPSANGYSPAGSLRQLLGAG